MPFMSFDALIILDIYVTCQVFFQKIIMNIFSVRLKELRAKKQLMQQTVANDCNLSVRQLIRYEQGVSEPTLTGLIILSRYFNVSIDYLVGESDNPKRR